MTPIPPRKTDNRPAAGFTLIELAVVLVIVTLLTTGMMMTLSVQREVQQLAEVRRQLADIREALLGYAMANGRLPPPADPTKRSGVDTDAGKADDNRVNSSGTGGGVLPWATLGLPETDPWGNRFTYRVTKGFADLPPGASFPPCPAALLASFVLCNVGGITVKDGPTAIVDNSPAVVVSHGKNGLGAYRPDGGQVAGAAGDELENSDNNTDFVSRTQAPDFDDELTWVPLPILMNRMVTAGRLP